MPGFHYKQGQLHADGLPVSELAGRFGSPAYIYSAGQIRKNFHELQTALANNLPADRLPLIAYACKANSNIAILKLLSTMGAGIDTVSVGEMQRARAASIQPEKTVLSGVSKTDDEITAAIENGILQLNVESAPEMERIAAIAETRKTKAKIAFRLNPDVDAKTHAKITTGKSENKFGMDADTVETLYHKADKHPYLDPRGLSLHIGSQLTQLQPYEEAFQILAAFTRKLREQGLNITSLDLGGGLGITYNNETPPDLDQYARLIREIIEPLGTILILEPGRMLVGNAGILLCRIVYIKESATKRFVILDTGMNDLIRPALYDAYHPIWPVTQGEAKETVHYDIVGPVCETGDTFATNAGLPPLSQNDYLAIGAAGAYGYVMASNYNSRPFAPEILVDDTHSAVIRPRQDIQDIIDTETIPDWI